MWLHRLLAQTPVGLLRKPDIHDPGRSGSSCDETFKFSVVTFFLFFIFFLSCCPTLQVSFIALDSVILTELSR